MKVLQVTHRYPPQVGGVETHVKEISERLVERGHDVTVFSADAGLNGESHEGRNGVQVRRFHSVAPGGAFYFAPSIASAVRWADVDVVHAHNYHALPSLAAAVGVGDARFVFTTHYHGSSVSYIRDRLLSLYRYLGGWAIRRADVVVAVSEWEQGRLWEAFGVEATVIENGIDVERFGHAEPENRDRPYLLSVGRIEGYKGIHHMIRALPELPEFDLLIAGDGPYVPDLKRIIGEYSVSDRVALLGHVDDERLPGLYAGAAALLNLSELEAYGLTVGEALATRTPAVVRKEGALAEWTRKNGVVGVESVDPHTVAAGISEAVDLDPDGSELPSWSTVVTELTAVYRG